MKIKKAKDLKKFERVAINNQIVVVDNVLDNPTRNDFEFGFGCYLRFHDGKDIRGIDTFLDFPFVVYELV